MAKTFKIAVNPTFKATVEIPRVDSETPMSVPFTFKTMNRRQLAALFDSWKTQTHELLDEATEAGEAFTLSDWAEREIQNQVGQIKSIVVGWGFDEEFNDENIEALVETCVSVTDAIVEKYNDAYRKAKSGN